MVSEGQYDGTVGRAARTDGAVDCTHTATQDNAVAAVRMLFVQVSSPIFRSESIPHSIRVHAGPQDLS
jgi:hypothetical protein